MKRLLFSLLASSLLNACATTHITPAQESPLEGLVASCTDNPSLNLTGYRGIQCTFENKSNINLKFKISEISFSNPDAKIVSRSEAEDVMSAWQAAKEQETQNRKIGTLAVLGIGFLAILSGEPGMADAGLAAVAGASIYDDAKDIKDGYYTQQYGKSEFYSYGDTVLNKKIHVPANLYVKKGFLVESEYNIGSVELCFDNATQCQWFPLLGLR